MVCLVLVENIFAFLVHCSFVSVSLFSQVSGKHSPPPSPPPPTPPPSSSSIFTASVVSPCWPRCTMRWSFLLGSSMSTRREDGSSLQPLTSKIVSYLFMQSFRPSRLWLRVRICVHIIPRGSERSPYTKCGSCHIHILFGYSRTDALLL